MLTIPRRSWLDRPPFSIFLLSWTKDKLFWCAQIKFMFLQMWRFKWWNWKMVQNKNWNGVWNTRQEKLQSVIWKWHCTYKHFSRCVLNNKTSQKRNACVNSKWNWIIVMNKNHVFEIYNILNDAGLWHAFHKMQQTACNSLWFRICLCFRKSINTDKNQTCIIGNSTSKSE